jgi:hypothetical protein
MFLFPFLRKPTPSVIANDINIFLASHGGVAANKSFRLWVFISFATILDLYSGFSVSPFVNLSTACRLVLCLSPPITRRFLHFLLSGPSHHFLIWYFSRLFNPELPCLQIFPRFLFFTHFMLLFMCKHGPYPHAPYSHIFNYLSPESHEYLGAQFLWIYFHRCGTSPYQYQVSA